MPNYYGNPYQYQPNYYQSQQAQPQIQNGGFVGVRNEMEARNYPVALGNSVTFKDETAPYIYTKTMGFSQLDVPKFDKYKLVKETPSEASDELIETTYDDGPILNTIDSIKDEISSIWSEIEHIKDDCNKPETHARRTTKKEKDGDD